MKVGDLIQYADPDGTRYDEPTGMVIHIYEADDHPHSRELVEILWAECGTAIHDAYELEVISESR